MSIRLLCLLTVLVAVIGMQTPAAAADALIISRIDTSGLAGGDVAMAIGRDGLPIVSFVRGDGAGGVKLRVVHCRDSACTASDGHDIDTGGLAFELTSLKIGADGNPVLVYLVDVCCLFEQVTFARCVDTVCSSATIQSFAFADQDVVGKPSVTIGGDGLPLVTYEDKFGGGTSDQVVNVVHCLAVDCSRTRFTTVARTGGRGMPGSSITTGTNGLGVIAYHDAPSGNGALVVTACGNADCSAGNITTTIDSTRGQDTGVLPAITIGPDATPLISYTEVHGTESTLKMAHCLNITCTAATVTVVESGGLTGWFTSIATGTDGLSVVSFHNIDRNTLRVAHCTTVACNATVNTTIDTNSGSRSTGIGIGGRDGFPVIVYPHRDSTSEIRLAHCADTACSS